MLFQHNIDDIKTRGRQPNIPISNDAFNTVSSVPGAIASVSPDTPSVVP